MPKKPQKNHKNMPKKNGRIVDYLDKAETIPKKI